MSMLPPNWPLHLLRAAALLSAGGLMTGFVLYQHHQANLVTPSAKAQAPASPTGTFPNAEKGSAEVDEMMFTSSKSGPIIRDLPVMQSLGAPARTATPRVIAPGSKSIDGLLFVKPGSLDLQSQQSAPLPSPSPKLLSPKIFAPSSKSIGNVFPKELLNPNVVEDEEFVSSLPADPPPFPSPNLANPPRP